MHSRREYYAVGKIVDQNNYRLRAVQVPIHVDQIPMVPMVIRFGQAVATLICTAPITYREWGEPVSVWENSNARTSI